MPDRWEEQRQEIADQADRRQRARIFQRVSTLLHWWNGHGFQILEVTLTTAPGGDAARLMEHFAELRRRIEREHGYGNLQHFALQTKEGHGVLHTLIAWTGRGEFFVDQRWLSTTWEEIHGARIVMVKDHHRFRPHVKDATHAAASYLASQYLKGQQAIVRYGWSWRRTFQCSIVRLWKDVRTAFGWEAPIGDIVRAWHQILDGETVEIEGTAYRLAGGIP